MFSSYPLILCTAKKKNLILVSYCTLWTYWKWMTRVDEIYPHTHRRYVKYGFFAPYWHYFSPHWAFRIIRCPHSCGYEGPVLILFFPLLKNIQWWLKNYKITTDFFTWNYFSLCYINKIYTRSLKKHNKISSKYM